MSVQVNPPLTARERRNCLLVAIAVLLGLFILVGWFAQLEQAGLRDWKARQERSASHVRR